MSYARKNSLAPPAEAWQKAYDYDAAGNVIYEGWAEPGTATSAAGWVIIARTFSGNNMTSEKLADGDILADNVYDDRAGLTYV